MFGLIGPDGAGKTTTIRLICGLLRADGGTRRASSATIRSATIARSPQSVGYLSQRFSLYGDLSIDENIAFFAEIHGVARLSSRARDRLLELTQLTPFRDRLADQLSGGMKQKLALACTLVHEPQRHPARRADDRRRSGSRREFWKLLSEFLRRASRSSCRRRIWTKPSAARASRCCTRAGCSRSTRRRAARSLPGQLFEVIVADHRAPR